MDAHSFQAAPLHSFHPTLKPFLLPEPEASLIEVPSLWQLGSHHWKGKPHNTVSKGTSLPDSYASLYVERPLFGIQYPAERVVAPVSSHSASPAGGSTASSIRQSIPPKPYTHHLWRAQPHQLCCHPPRGHANTSPQSEELRLSYGYAIFLSSKSARTMLGSSSRGLLRPCPSPHKSTGVLPLN